MGWPARAGEPLRWSHAAGSELLHFGKWIFLSTLCGFVLTQGDEAILGGCLSLDDLGICNIGYFLAPFPMLLAGAVAGRVIIPPTATIRQPRRRRTPGAAADAAFPQRIGAGAAGRDGPDRSATGAAALR